MGVRRCGPLVAVSLLVVAAGCGDGSSDGAVGRPSSSTTPLSPPVSSPSPSVSPVPSVSSVPEPVDGWSGLVRVPVEVAGLPKGDLVDGGCTGVYETAWVTRAQLVLEGRPVRVSERGMVSGGGRGWIGRVVELEVSDVIINTDDTGDGDRDGDGGSIAVGDLVRVLVADTEFNADARWEDETPDVDQVAGRELVTVFGYSWEGFVRPHRIVSPTPDGVSFNGYCGEDDLIAWVADHVGEADPYAMLHRFSAGGDELEAELSAAYAAWADWQDSLNAPPLWEEQDPSVRILSPGAVSDEVRPLLDVVGVSFELDDLGDGTAVGVRTESGLSEPLVGPGALPSVSTLFFLTGIDETVTVVVRASADANSAEQTIGTVPLVDVLAAGGGIAVTGSVAAGDVTVVTLTRVEIAERLGIDVDGLDALRDQVLNDPMF